MALVMTADEFHEAYPNGMDDDDRATWSEAVARSCEHDEAPTVADALGRSRICCPTCGVDVDVEQLRVDWELDAEQRAEQAIGC